jgi:hypothetical protein
MIPTELKQTVYSQALINSGDKLGPHIYLQENGRLAVSYTDATGLETDLAAAQAQPLSLAAGELDEGGMTDLVAGYEVAGGGVIAIQRGNLDAFAPQSEKSWKAIGRGEYPSPYLKDARVLKLPVKPDFVAVGNLTGDEHPDLVVAARGGDKLYLLAGDGQGGFSEPQALGVGGAITTLAAGDYGNEQPGFTNLLVGVVGTSHPTLIVYSGTEQGPAEHQRYSLTAPASSVAFGDLDGDSVSDAAIVADNQAHILHGASTQLETLTVPISVSALALGSFVSDRQGGLQMALLSPDGSLHIAARGGFDPRPLTPEEAQARVRVGRRAISDPQTFRKPVASAQEWEIVESIAGVAPLVNEQETPLILRTRISSNAADDVMVLNAAGRQMKVVSHPDPAIGTSTFAAGEVSEISSSGSPVAALSVRVNIDGRPGVVALNYGQVSPSVMMPLPDPTFFVNRTDDPAPSAVASTCNNANSTDTSTSCSLREAIRKANATAGTDTIMLAAGTYTLTQPRVANDFTAAHGTLDVTDSVNIVGAGQNSTIIQGGTNATTSVDKVFSFNQDIAAFTNATVSLSNLTIQFGHNRGNTGIQDGWGGAFDFDTGGTTAGTGNATLSVTNVTIQNNSLTDGEGGGFAIFNTNSGSGNATITNCIIQNNSATRSTANAAGNGGGIFVAFPASATLNNTQVINNTATQINGTGKGVGGGIFIIGGGTKTQTTIHGGSISGNQASGDGGGIWSDASTTIDQQAVISNNSAGGNGGGIWYNGSAANTASFSKITITGNSANGNGTAFSGNGGGILSGNTSLGPTMSMSFSRIAGNSAAVSGAELYNAGSTITATDNWWGTNSPASVISTAAGTTTFDPFITLTNTASPNLLSIGPPNPSSTITASFLQDNHGTAIAVANLNVLIGLPASASIFPGAPTHGTLSNVQTSIQANGQATETFTSTSSGVETINAVVDQAIVPANITILAPPTISKAFGAATIPVNGATKLTFTVTNPLPNTLAIHGVGFSDSFPSGLSVAATPGVVNTCGGTFTAAAGATTVSLSGATVNPGASGNPGTCAVAVNVTGSPDGVRNNVSGPVSSTDAGTQNNTASAALTVINPPHIIKAFGTASIPLNGTISLTFTIDSNSNQNLTLTGAAFTDSLPPGLVVASPGNVTTNCNNGTVTAADGSSTVKLSGASVAPNSQCAVSVTVQGTTAGVKNNSVQVSSTNAGTGNTSNASLDVVDVNIGARDARASRPAAGTATILFTVTLSNAAPGTLTVNYATADGATSPAAGGGSCDSGADYVSTSGALTFNAGEQVKTIPVTICANGAGGPDRTLFLNLSSASVGTIQRSQATGTITAANPAGTFIISELRTSGPAGAGDQFVELYNNTDSPLTVQASDSSGGYGLFKMGSDCNSSPVLIATIPNGTVIPARGHYLVIGSQYSISAYAAGDQTMTSDVESDHNVAIFTTADVANISTVNRLDAVGFGSNVNASAPAVASGATALAKKGVRKAVSMAAPAGPSAPASPNGVCDLLREGNTLPPVSGSTTEHSFFRKECDFVGGVGCTVAGNPKDTNDNSADLKFADTQGAFISGVPQQMGAPGPENKTSPIRRDSTIAVQLLDNTVASSSPPNRVRDLTSNPGNNSTFGTLSIRRRILNNTGGAVTRLRFRIVEVTTFPSPGGGVADVRAITSADVVVSGVNDAATCVATGTPTTVPCQVTAKGTTLETPPSQPNGGGLNSTLAVGSVNLGAPLASQASVDVQFLLGIEMTGSFRFLIITEALP